MKKTPDHLKFDKRFFRDFWYLLKPYWVSEEKWKALSLLTLQIIGSIIGVRVSVALNTLNKTFYDALQNFNKAVLLTSLFHFILLIGLLLLAYGYSFYFNSLLNIRWRKWLTQNYLKRWLHDHRYYHMQLSNNKIDNPDQRISEDLESFSEKTLSVFFMISESLMRLISFGYILWNLSGSLSIPIGKTHIEIPGYLLFGAFFYAVLGTYITGWMGKKLASLDYQQQYFNADFRFALVRLRESSEQIALYRGEEAENNKCKYLFSKIFSNFMSIATLRKRLMFFTSGYSTTTYLLGTFMAIPLYLQKKVQLGGMMQISGAFSSVIYSFSILVNGFSLFAEWRAVIFRLTEFNHFIEKSNKIPSPPLLTPYDGNDIILRDFTLFLPHGEPLMRQINLTFKTGESYLLKGASGLGKSTLLRALANLWPYGEGKIYLPKNKKIFFLPQKPYLPLGPLKEILCYPDYRDIQNENLYEALQYSFLSKFQSRLDEIRNWAHEFSLGEQQMVAFSRIFLQKPNIVFLDEATSALDEETEFKLYQNLKKYLPEAMLISIGHRSSLHSFHENIIMLASYTEEGRAPKLATGTE